MQFLKDEKYYSFAKSELVKLLPSANGRFLEIGCGEGATLEYVKALGASYTAGVDISADAIAVASRRGLDVALAADVEKDALPFLEKEFDCVIVADVLEHLVNPWDTLKRLVSYVKDDGHVLLSVPNIRYYRVLRDLVLHGAWTYSDSGILDSTHLRFFTLKEIQKLLEHAGLDMLKLDWKIHAGRVAKAVNAFFVDSLRSFLIFQYHILAKKRTQHTTHNSEASCKDTGLLS
jgi:methionine biosynthesis protein MetW